eukprot:scaffold9420_cov51-Prasinocladus_malaysianus.AAC.1
MESTLQAYNKAPWHQNTLIPCSSLWPLWCLFSIIQTARFIICGCAPAAVECKRLKKWLRSLG